MPDHDAQAGKATAEMVAATELRESGTYGFWRHATPGSAATRSAFGR